MVMMMVMMMVINMNDDGEWRWPQFKSYSLTHSLQIGVVPFTYVAPTTKVLCDHIRRLVDEPVEDEEFMRAKNQLKSMIFMNLEQRSLYCEEIGQQFLSFGRHNTPEEWSDAIDALTKEDIMKAMGETLKYPVAYSVFGKDVSKNLNTIPPVDAVKAYLMMPYKPDRRWVSSWIMVVTIP